MSTLTNGRQAPIDANASTSRAWTVHDASELYEVSRWGNGYFSVNAAGHLQVHPTKDPSTAIDLKELVDRLQLRGISLPVLIRFTDILKHRLGEIHERLPGRHRPEPVPGRLPLRLPDQGQPAAPRRRGGAQLRQAVQLRARGRLQAGAARRGGASPTTTRRSSATASRTPSSSRRRCWPRRSAATSSRWSRSSPSWGSSSRSAEKHRRAAADRHAREAGVARQRPLAVVGRLPLEVRPDGHRDHARARGAEERTAWRTASSSCTSTSAARSPTSASSRARSTRRPASTPSWPSSGPGCSTSTSAAGWAWTTTARRPTSSRA